MSNSIFTSQERYIPEDNLELVSELAAVCNDIREDLSDTGDICGTCLRVLDALEQIVFKYTLPVVEIDSQEVRLKDKHLQMIDLSNDDEDNEEETEDTDENDGKMFAALRWKK